MRSLWAAGLLLRRFREERGFGLLVVVLVAATAFVFAAAPRLFNRVGDDALRHVAEVAPPAQRNITLLLDSQLPPSGAGGVGGVRDFGNNLADHFPASVAELITSRTFRVTTVRFSPPHPPVLETHVSLRYQDGFLDQARLVGGHWPVNHDVNLQTIVPGSGVGDTELAVFEIALSSSEASEIGVKLGDRVPITLDGSDPLVRRNPFQLARTELEIVGLYEPIDASAPYWEGDTALIQVVRGGTEDDPIAFATAYAPAEMYPGLAAGNLPFHYEWRFEVSSASLDGDKVPQLRDDLRKLARITGSANGATGTAVLVTSLPKILDRYAAERALAESILSIAAIGPLGLAAGAMGMVAILLVRRRRAGLALARGRGASGTLVLGTELWEAILLAGSAAAIGYFAAVLLVPARGNPLSATLTVAVAIGSVGLIVLASLPAARRPLGLIERDDVPLRSVAPRRLVIELTIVAIAAGAALLLRQRGLTISAESTADGVPSVDPLLASVPVLSGLAAGIVALRLYPLPIRALGWLAARRRDIIPVLGLRTIGRRPAAANLPLLVLMLTAAFGAFSSVIAASLDRGQLAASYLDVGADFRVESVGDGSLPASANPAAVAGVEAVARGFVDRFAGLASSPTQRSSIYLEAIDPSAYDAVLAGTPVEPQWPFEFLDPPQGADVGTDANPIPVILSTLLPVGTPDPAIGATFGLTVYGQPMTFRLVERRDAFPGIGPRTPFVIVPFNWVIAAKDARLVTPTALWLRAPGNVLEPLKAALVGVPGGTRVVSRYDAFAVLHDAPLSAAVTGGFAIAVVIAAIYMAITVVGALVLSAARRRQDLAYLRTLGVSGRQSVALTLMEHAPPVLLAVIPGIALGIGIAVLCQPGLGLAAFVGASGVPLYVDWARLWLLAGALVGVVATAVIIGTWLSRRARLVDALRIGEH